MDKICEKCNKIYTKKYHESVKNWNIRKYCSHSCSNSVNSLGAKHCIGREPVNKGKKYPEYSGENHPNWKSKLFNCLQCDKQFYVPKHRWEKTKFCCRRCAFDYRDNGKTPKHEKIRKSVEYSNWRTAIFERDDYTCQICSQKGGKLNADHIKRFSEFPDLRLDLSNGRTLCEDCHKKTDTYGNRKVNITTVGQEA